MKYTFLLQEMECVSNLTQYRNGEVAKANGAIFTHILDVSNS